MKKETTPTEPGDAEVFAALSEAQKQYEQYLRITATADLMQVWSEAPVVPPSEDLPLTLTVWSD